MLFWKPFLFFTDPQNPCPHDRDHHPWREQRNRQGARRKAHPRLHRWLHPQEVPVNLPHAGVCKRMQTRYTKQLLSKQLPRFRDFVHMAWKKPENLMPWDYCPGFCISFMRFSGHVIVDKPKICTSIRLQSLDVNISNRLPGNCAQIITWCFATPIHGLNWIGYYYPGTWKPSISLGYQTCVQLD